MISRKTFLQVVFLLFLVIGTVWIIRSQNDTPYQKDSGEIFGTYYHITYQSSKDLQPEIEAELKKVDASLSAFNPHSIISAVNRNENVKVNDMFSQVFLLAERISQDTDGAFDITVGPLVNAWGFGTDRSKAPSKATVDSLRQLVGYQHVSLNNDQIKKSNPNIKLDCSAIAKGYGADVVANYFKRKGIENYLIEIGGEIVTSGNSEKRLPWKIGVIKPSDDSLNINQETQTVINVTDRAMATSGNYRNYRYVAGKKYAHTIDPKTGYPVQHSLLSATVLASDCATADAYATAFMVMGVDKAKKLLEHHPELMAYFIYAGPKGEMKVWYSPSLQDKVEK
ncbi:MAG: FAD:protein FMN transferase [Prevotella sp.]